MRRKGVIDMVAFIVGFAVMILLIILGSYFLIDGEVSTNLEAEVGTGGTTVQGILAANAIHKSDRVDLHSRMYEYYNGGDQDDIESNIEDEANDLLNNSYSRYEFEVEGTDIRVENDYPPGIFTFYVSSPDGPKEVQVMVDEQEGRPYDPVIGGSG